MVSKSIRKIPACLVPASQVSKLAAGDDSHVMLAVIKKSNGEHMTRLVDFIAKKFKRQNLPTLVVDDECDEASVATNKMMGKSDDADDDDDDPSLLSGVPASLRNLRNTVANLPGRDSNGDPLGTTAYLGYTATPQARAWRHAGAQR